MSVYRLETFSPGFGAAAKASARSAEAAREEGWQEGFLAGQSAAAEAFLDDQGRLTSQLVEALEDARLSTEAARHHVLRSIAPTIEALAGAIAPALAEAGLGPELVRLVERALLQAPDARPRLRCAPEVAGRIRTLLAEHRLDAIVEPAAELLPREAQVFWDHGYDHIDLDACVAQIRASIASHLDRNREAGDE